jgi:bifunctional DNA-binding transcriptional regulator/antitoxin component of YhaV-PrlF toxin-antitoxin module
MMAKTHSATVKVIKDGRVTIPQEIREVEGIAEGDFIKITIEKIERRGKPS